MNELERLIEQVQAKLGLTRPMALRWAIGTLERIVHGDPPPPRAPQAGRRPSSIPPGYEPMVEREVARRLKELG